MRSLILTTGGGTKVRLNPMQMLGWVDSEVPLGDGKVILGSVVALIDGPRLVRESPEQIDHLFERATDGWLRPPVTREDLERIVDAWRSAATAED